MSKSEEDRKKKRVGGRTVKRVSPNQTASENQVQDSDPDGGVVNPNTAGGAETNVMEHKKTNQPSETDNGGYSEVDQRETGKSLKQQENRAHVISFMSGKGGTGKTVIAVSLGTLLMKIGFRVLFVDLDFATDGMSLFIAGGTGLGDETDAFRDGVFKYQTAADVMLSETEEKLNPFVTRDSVNQSKAFSESQRLEWQALFTSPAAFGDYSGAGFQPRTGFEESSYEIALTRLFDTIHASGAYDYVVVDTRGGFDIGTALVGKFVDSLVLVSEPDRSSLNQSYRLVHEILDCKGADNNQTGSIFRGLIVNKSVKQLRENEEWVEDAEGDFRNIFETLIGIPYKNHYVMPLDDAVVLSYRENINPILSRPESMFSLALLHGFTNLFGTEIEKWSSDQQSSWNEVAEVLVRENNRRLDEESASFKQRMHADPEFIEKGKKLADIDKELKELQFEFAYHARTSEREEKRYSDHIDQEKQRSIRLEQELEREKFRHDDMIKRLESTFNDRVSSLQRRFDEILDDTKGLSTSARELSNANDSVSAETKHSLSNIVKLVEDARRESSLNRNLEEAVRTQSKYLARTLNFVKLASTALVVAILLLAFTGGMESIYNMFLSFLDRNR